MTPELLKSARLARGWNQLQAAARLDVTQAYLSMMEKGRRSPAPLTQKLMRVYGLPPTVLPLAEMQDVVTPDFMARELAALGYPGFAHLRTRKPRTNPALFLLTALAQRNLEARVSEGLPWLLLKYSDMDSGWLLREARARNLQNRLGFVVTLARSVTPRDDLRLFEEALVDSKLVREDSFCKELTAPERQWLLAHRSEQALQWNLLSDLRPDGLRHVD